MGTATFSIHKQPHNRGSATGTVAGELGTSGAHTTSTTVSSLTDGAAGAGSAITGVKGDILRVQIGEPARVQFGAVDSTATLGHIIFTSETLKIENVVLPSIATSSAYASSCKRRLIPIPKRKYQTIITIIITIHLILHF